MPPAKKSKMAVDPKQTTLFKHISGVPPPKKEQPTLDGLWGKTAATKGAPFAVHWLAVSLSGC